MPCMMHVNPAQQSSAIAMARMVYAAALTMRIAPADLRRAMQEASLAGWLSSALSRKISEPYSVGKSRDWIISLAPKGMPNSGCSFPPARPVARIWSAATAASVSPPEPPRCAQAPTTESVDQHNRALQARGSLGEVALQSGLGLQGPLYNTVCLMCHRNATASHHDLRSAEDMRTPRQQYLLQPA